MKDVTPEFCGEIENEKYFPRLTKASSEQFKTSKIDSGQFESFDDQWMTGKVMSMALQYIFCRRFDKALDVIHQMWPQEDQANLIKILKKEISQPWVCPDCAKEMEKWY